MPANLMAYELWMKQTAVMGRFRSDELKKLDEAMKTFSTLKSDVNEKKVKETFAAWKGKQGAGWLQSTRNRMGAIGALEDALNPRGPTTYTNDQAHSRKGVMYLFANTELDFGLIGFGKLLLEGGADLVDLGSSLPGSKITDLASSVTKKSTSVAVSAIEAASNYKSASKMIGPENNISLKEKVIAKFKEYVAKIWALLKTRAKEFWEQTAWDKVVDIASYTTKIVLWLGEKLFKDVVPFLSAGVDIVKGVYATANACYDRYQAYSLGKNVVLNEGHPGAVADSIERAMNLGIGAGLYQTLKGGVSMAGAAVTGGAFAIVNFVISGCELLAKFVYRIWETMGMRAFFADCKKKWERAKASGGRDESWTDANEFKAWYRNAAYALPCLSALAINSHITGDAMMYMQCFTDRSEKEAVSQGQFDQGVKYLTHIKEWSRKYLADAGYEFSSNDPLVKNIHATSTSSKPRKIPIEQMA